MRDFKNLTPEAQAELESFAKYLRSGGRRAHGKDFAAWRKDGELEMRVLPENYWREVWHDAECRSPCYHRNEFLTIEDGSRLRLYECVRCSTKVFAGLDARRHVVHRAYAPVASTGERPE